MNKQIHQIARLSDQEVKLIIGLMAGTSLDGLDIALCRIKSSGLETEAELLEFQTMCYPETMVDKLRDIAFKEQVDQKELSRLHRDLGNWYGKCTLDSLEVWDIPSEQIDLIASHGQTVYHQPQTAAADASTLQIGDGDHIAVRTGIPTISDFRQKFIAAVGEGAPITPHIDRILFSSREEERILLNIGGIANYTWLAKQNDREDNVKFSYSDTGPGNTLINQAVRQYLAPLTYDEEGEIASKGKVSSQLLDQLLQHPFMEQEPPKSTGPEAFQLEWVEQLEQELNLDLDDKDVIATLTRFTVESIARSLEALGKETLSRCRIFVSGGGWHNLTLVQDLNDRLEGVEIHSFQRLGMDPDAREAVSFAVLANQTLSGRGIPINTYKGERYIRPGKISQDEPKLK